ncbi:uncharacterized protein LOC128932329 [Callithrix jacchus]
MRVEPSDGIGTVIERPDGARFLTPALHPVQTQREDALTRTQAWDISALDSSSREREAAQPSTNTSVLLPPLELKNLPLLSETKTQQDFLVCRPRFCFVFGGQGIFIQPWNKLARTVPMATEAAPNCAEALRIQHK